jgi:HEAT repeat protein
MDYRQFLPHPPQECCDPELFRLLNEFHFVRWNPDHQARRDEVWKLITSTSIIARAEKALDDPYERLRQYSGQLLIWVRRQDAVHAILKLLQDQSDFVRGSTAEVLAQMRCDACLPRIIELATSDSSAYVRGCASAALGGQNPVVAIPVLLKILDTDHEPSETGHTPSGRAATALDEMMETEWTQKRHQGGLRSLNPDGIDLDALRQQANLFLRHCLERGEEGF